MPLITQIMREWLDKLGLPQTDLVILKNVIGASNLAEGRAAGGFVGPEFIRQRFVVKGKEYIIPVFHDLTYGLIQIAFNMDHYQLVNERIKRNNYTDPAIRKQDTLFLKEMIMKAYGSMNHEAIHALKNLGLFTYNERNILRKAARDHWIKDMALKVTTIGLKNLLINQSKKCLRKKL